ncbi:MAG TPA: YraN family protein [Candidatus Paceibacterota bacterium]|nr:YraN family protein [Candidatus Paceibacterota bacterium]
MARHNEIGKMGESLAADWLRAHGFSIIEQNHRQKWGEIDIVARETAGGVHFVEVKTVSYETREVLEHAVSHGTWRPEEQVHTAKRARLKRVIESWLAAHPDCDDWQIDVVAVRLVPREKFGTIKLLGNVVFE